MKLHGLVAATHTAFHADGSLNLAPVERQAEHLSRTGAAAVFVGGSTGESASLTIDERLALARRWSEVIPGSGMRLIIHIGSNSPGDSRALAEQAAALRADAVSAVGPSYFKPASVEVLVQWCEQITAPVREVPFYFYDIPPLTGVSLSMPDFLEAAAGRLPNLTGIKYSNPDLLAYQVCLRSHGARFDMPWGIDEYLLAALALGGAGGIGSSYNFAAPLGNRILAAFRRGDLETAREEQFRLARLIRLLAGYGYMGAAKLVMGRLGIPVGPARLPNTNPTPERGAALLADLDRLDFEWAA